MGRQPRFSRQPPRRHQLTRPPPPLPLVLRRCRPRGGRARGPDPLMVSRHPSRQALWHTSSPLFPMHPSRPSAVRRFNSPGTSNSPRNSNRTAPNASEARWQCLRHPGVLVSTRAANGLSPRRHSPHRALHRAPPIPASIPLRMPRGTCRGERAWEAFPRQPCPDSQVRQAARHPRPLCLPLSRVPLPRLSIPMAAVVPPCSAMCVRASRLSAHPRSFLPLQSAHLLRLPLAAATQ